jgi:hypothetical protein
MTTIAYRAGVMACDSCWTSEEAQTVSATKIQRLKSGALFGASGDNDVRDVIALLDRVRKSEDLPLRSQLVSVQVDCSAILVFPNGEIFQVGTGRKTDDDDIGAWQVNRGFAAVGTGAHLALGAMGAGRGAAQAVAIACKFDINSRPPIHQVCLKPQSRRSR